MALPNFSKFQAPAAPKLCHLIQFFPKIFKNSHFSPLSTPKNVSLKRQNAPQAVGPLQFDPCFEYFHQSLTNFSFRTMIDLYFNEFELRNCYNTQIASIGFSDFWLFCQEIVPPPRISINNYLQEVIWYKKTLVWRENKKIKKLHPTIERS